MMPGPWVNLLQRRARAPDHVRYAGKTILKVPWVFYHSRMMPKVANPSGSTYSRGEDAPLVMFVMLGSRL